MVVLSHSILHVPQQKDGYICKVLKKKQVAKPQISKSSSTQKRTGLLNASPDRGCKNGLHVPISIEELLYKPIGFLDYIGVASCARSRILCCVYGSSVELYIFPCKDMFTEALSHVFVEPLTKQYQIIYR